MSAEEDLCCPVCYDIFKDPVVLSCCHSVCKACLEEFWKTKERRECPLCKVLNLNDPECNSVLKSLCEAYLEEYSQRYAAGSKQHCRVHGEKLKLFCLEDKQAVCQICQMSSQHHNHECYPIEEAADHFRMELKTELKPFQETLDCFSQVKQSYHKATAHIKRQTLRTEQQIRDEFKKLYQFLRIEEADRLLALRKEEKEKTQLIEKKLEEIDREMSSLLKLIRIIEEDMWTEDLLFIQDTEVSNPLLFSLAEENNEKNSFETSLTRAKCSLQDPEMISGTLIDEATHLGNLAYRAWVKMKDIVQYNPIILDPNTAHKSLTLSEDLTSATFNETQDMTHLPDNPERFKSSVCVLGSEGFASGNHCWDVEVGDRSLWEVGITTESNPKNACLFYNSVWSVESNFGFYTRSPARPKSPFSAEGGLERIRIHLDCERGQVSFSDPLNDTEIKTFNYTFTEKVYPFFWCHNKSSPVKILPMTILPRTVLETE